MRDGYVRPVIWTKIDLLVYQADQCGNGGSRTHFSGFSHRRWPHKLHYPGRFYLPFTRCSGSVPHLDPGYPIKEHRGMQTYSTFTTRRHLPLKSIQMATTALHLSSQLTDGQSVLLGFVLFVLGDEYILDHQLTLLRPFCCIGPSTRSRATGTGSFMVPPHLLRSSLPDRLSHRSGTGTLQLFLPWRVRYYLASPHLLPACIRLLMGTARGEPFSGKGSRMILTSTVP